MPNRTPALQKNAQLQDDIRATTVNFGQAAFWWLGQATVAIKLGKTLVYIDPFFRADTDDPPTLQETPLRPSEFTDAALICCTHEHFDHIDPKTLPGAAAASPLARIVVPEHTREFTLKLGIPESRLTCLRGDDSFEHSGITVHAIPAAHMSAERSDAHGYRYLGYVLHGNGVTIYHAGDTQPYPGWADRIARFKLDIAFLPISGVDNLYWQQAVYFCCHHRPGVVIPIHYGMFKGYTEDPEKLKTGLSKNFPAQPIKIPHVGEKLIHSALP